MTTPITNQLSQSAGLCPHGLPYGLCPICSKMAGGGVKKNSKPQIKVQNTNQWSYMKCYIEGMRLKHLKDHKEQLKLDFLQKSQALQHKILEMIKISSNYNAIIKIPVHVVLNTVNFVLNVIIQTSLMLKTLNQNLKDILQFVQDKIVAILSEIKEFIRKKIEKKVKEKLKDKFLAFIEKVMIFTVEEGNNDSTKSD
ncbi:hypothetical protein IJ670_00090 [bacterium]|nr:hypothetical protein [bacterium]